VELPLDQIVGPAGALVLAVTGLGLAVRQHIKDDAEKLALANKVAASREADLAHERARVAAAEARLDAFGPVLKGATDVMVRSVAVTEKVIEIAGRAQDRYDWEYAQGPKGD
jgi:hypothetical protein